MSEPTGPTPPPATGHASVDEALAALGDLSDADAGTRLAKLTEAQEKLVAALDSSRAGDPQRPGVPQQHENSLRPGEPQRPAGPPRPGGWPRPTPGAGRG